MTRHRHRNRFTFAFVTLLVLAFPALGRPYVLIVQSSPIEAYQQAVAGFTQYFTTTSLPGIASIQPNEIIILGQATSETVANRYQEVKPELVIAVGTSALEVVKGFTTPIIYLMVPNPDAITKGQGNIVGISMMTDPEQQLSAIKATFPAATRVAIIHNPARNGDYVKLVRAAQSRFRLTVTDLPVNDDKEALNLLSSQSNHFDALLLTPDPSLITPILMNGLALYSLEQHVPLVAFAPKYLDQGAAMVVYTSPEQAGKQAAELAKRSLSGQLGTSMRQEYGREATRLTNDRIIQKLGIPTSRSQGDQEVLLP